MCITFISKSNKVERKTILMRKIITFVMLAGTILPACAQQRVLSLDSCRAMALRNNKQLNISRLQQSVALNVRKAARTKYLPKVDALGGYEYFSKEVSILNNSQKSALGNLGSTLVGHASTGLSSLVSSLTQQGLITPQMAQQIGSYANQLGASAAQTGNAIGQDIAGAFRTDTRNIWSGAVVVRQPVFMGGAILAMNRIADIGEDLAKNDIDLKQQTTLYDIDQTYWLVVSLRQKYKLATSYRDLVRQFNSNVHKMIREGVATRADGLKVDVRANEADMQVTQVEDGLTLSKMLLCQLCGLPLEGDIVLEDEDKTDLNTTIDHTEPAITDSSTNERPELRMLQNTIDISEQTTRLVRAAYLPHVLLTGGYAVSNPNVFNGFERKFAGVWNVGLTVQIPVWNWFEGTYKIRATKAATNIAQMELGDAREKIQLQITQSQFKVKEARKRLNMACENTRSAEENLRCANLGFKEGVMNTTDVMAAQTAWQQAQSQKIDAEIEVRLSLVGLTKALGRLRAEN